MLKQVGLALCCGALLLAGCPLNREPRVGKGGGNQKQKLTDPRQTLTKMLAAYASAKQYSDKGDLRLSFKQGGERQGNSWPCSCAYAAPNRLALHAFQVNIVCDGESLYADVEDRATDNLDGQMVERQAPPRLRLTDLSSDPVLYDLLCSRLGRVPIQLDLLLGNEELAQLLRDAELTLLDPEETDKRLCDRVAVRLNNGEFVFWIDQENHLLRRLDYPARTIFPELAADKSVRDLALYLELPQATFDQAREGAFRYVPSPDAKPVEALVTPPPPLPTKMLGKTKEGFSFSNLEGNRVSSEAWVDRAAILLWYGHDPSNAAALRQFAEVQSRFADESKLAFYAICAEPSAVTNEQVTKQLTQWKATTPVVRDLDAVGRDLFEIDALPTLVLLDDRNVVQFVEGESQSQLAQTLPQVLERLLGGADLAQEVLDRQKADRAMYEALLAKGGAKISDVIAVPQTTIKPAAPPTALKLKEMWSLKELKQPGNLLLVPTGKSEVGSDEILVCERHRGIARVSATGEIVSRQSLDLPPGTVCTYVRTMTSSAGGRYYAVSGPLAAQCLVYDRDWKRLLAYPPADQKHEGIRDVRLADLDHDGEPELYVGFWGVAGVHALTLEGERLWINRDYPTVSSLAISTANEIGWRRLLVTGDNGGILRINKVGNRDPELRVANWPLGQLVAADFDATQAQYMGLSQDPKTNQLVAVALDQEFHSPWDYPLPPGVHAHPVEYLQPAAILKEKRGAWLIAGADGALHVVSEDGEFSDSLAVGSAITGVAGGQLGDKPALLIATEQGLTAWEVE